MCSASETINSLSILCAEGRHKNRVQDSVGWDLSDPAGMLLLSGLQFYLQLAHEATQLPRTAECASVTMSAPELCTESAWENFFLRATPNGETLVPAVHDS